MDPSGGGGTVVDDCCAHACDARIASNKQEAMDRMAFIIFGTLDQPENFMMQLMGDDLPQDL
jgi:hypothetical protein